MMDFCNWLPAALFHRRLDRPCKSRQGEGVWIYDETGKKYLDASGGPICVNVGHGRTEVADAMAGQARQLAYVHGPMFTSAPVEALAQRLADHSPEGLNRFYFCSSGCEAVETAIKLARQIQLARGEAGRYRIDFPLERLPRGDPWRIVGNRENLHAGAVSAAAGPCHSHPPAILPALSLRTELSGLRRPMRPSAG